MATSPVLLLVAFLLLLPTLSSSLSSTPSNLKVRESEHHGSFILEDNDEGGTPTSTIIREDHHSTTPATPTTPSASLMPTGASPKRSAVHEATAAHATATDETPVAGPRKEAETDVTVSRPCWGCVIECQAIGFILTQCVRVRESDKDRCAELLRGRACRSRLVDSNPNSPTCDDPLSSPSPTSPPLPLPSYPINSGIPSGHCSVVKTAIHVEST